MSVSGLVRATLPHNLQSLGKSKNGMHNWLGRDHTLSSLLGHFWNQSIFCPFGAFSSSYSLGSAFSAGFCLLWRDQVLTVELIYSHPSNSCELTISTTYQLKNKRFATFLAERRNCINRNSAFMWVQWPARCAWTIPHLLLLEVSDHRDA